MNVQVDNVHTLFNGLATEFTLKLFPMSPNLLGTRLSSSSNPRDSLSMDLVQQCLKIRPQMHLTDAFSWFQSIALSLQGIQASQGQFRFLGRCIAQTLQALDRDYRSGTLSVATTTKAVSDFSTWVPLKN